MRDESSAVFVEFDEPLKRDAPKGSERGSARGDDWKGPE
jgi:hypothetical protein